MDGFRGSKKPANSPSMRARNHSLGPIIPKARFHDLSCQPPFPQRLGFRKRESKNGRELCCHWRATGFLSVLSAVSRVAG